MCARRPPAPLPLVAALLLVAGSATAQERGSAPALSDVVARLELGGLVRARSDDGTIVSGRLAETTRAGGLGLEPEGRTGSGVIALPPDAVDALWTGRRSGARGALLGGVAGAALGAVLTKVVGDLVCDAPDNDCDSGPSAKAWIALIGGGAALGAGIGWAAGRDHVRWRPVWPVPATDG